MNCSLENFLKREVTRKQFLKALSQKALFGLCLTGAFSPSCASAWSFLNKTDEQDKTSLVEAQYYKKLEGEEIQCLLCPHKCVVSKGDRGECGVRENRNGTYYTLTYGRPCALHVDPVEKKPLFHVMPGSRVYSLATAGCNLNCLFCQNWQISQALPEEVRYENRSPDEIVQMAVDMDCHLIAYTYSEPTIFFEYMLAIAKKAHTKGLINTCHSNGFINPEPLSELLRFMSAANIDLKGFTDEYYLEVCGGRLEPVLKSLKQIKKGGIHLELTNLVVPSKNDKIDDIKKMSKWISNELGPDVPLHFSRFYPRYKLRNIPPTPVETLEEARDVAMREGLKFVYIGNLQPGHKAENTYCPNCKKIVIERRGYVVEKNQLKGGKCPNCNKPISGLWE
ncbi:MAG: AmmeMemoRadiSam system radical SAM enzyme [bacterium]